MNRITETFQNWIDPLPPTQVASSLEGIKKAVMNTPEHWDVSVEWVKNGEEKESGAYHIIPVRDSYCSSTPLQPSSIAVETKKRIRQELSQKLTSLEKGSDFSNNKESLVGALSPMQDDHQKIAEKLILSLHHLDKENSRNPEGVVDREFLSDLLEEDFFTKIEALKVTPSHQENNYSEVEIITTLLNFIVQEPEAGKTNTVTSKTYPELYRATLLRDLLAPSNRILSAEAKKIAATLTPQIKEKIQDIRKNRANWIDAALNIATPLSSDQIAAYLTRP